MLTELVLERRVVTKGTVTLCMVVTVVVPAPSEAAPDGTSSRTSLRAMLVMLLLLFSVLL